ncbi:MAG: hypothetical protein GXO91_04450 [FCB group bacterium]|nr:hypothetical protein [FCB group bacterium]
MKKITLLMSVAAIGLLTLVGCGGHTPAVADDLTEIADPFQELQDMANGFIKDGNIAVVGVGTSTRQDIARDKARASAQAKLAESFETKVEVLKKKFTEELGSDMTNELNETFTNVIKTTSKTVLYGAIENKAKYFKDNKTGMISAGVVLYVSPDVMNQSLLDQMKNKPKLYERFRASEAYKELEKEMENYDQ